MKEYIKRILTRKLEINRRGVKVRAEIQPSDRLVYAVIFSLGMVACLTVLEAAHIAFLGRWNSEIFAVIAGLVGNITGIFLSQKT